MIGRAADPAIAVVPMCSICGASGAKVRPEQFRFGAKAGIPGSLVRKDAEFGHRLAIGALFELHIGFGEFDHRVHGVPGS